MQQEKAIAGKASHMAKKGLAAGFPLVLSYVPVAIAFGVVARQSGMNVFDIVMMSVLVYAGAAQFMSVNMMNVGAGALEIVIATFVLNFRHFIMSFSFMNRLRHIEFSKKAPLTLLLTDETFAVSSIHKEEAKKEKGIIFYTVLILSAYISWIFGTIVGALLGDIIPPKLSESMGIALYAMFIGLLVPPVKKEIRLGIIAVIAMILNAFFSQFMASGWSIVLGTIIGGASGIFLIKEAKA
ncbi:AzlC family ABC transporter permease [Aciduricibacillus chroicocephali]|uniref:AzlC family ABC transporter permease n=1 Tax=Aciduricibacillus chroicocephali TaxID=3054939 RepID=A0ABY9KXI0_9BACI|nr:AzlC family ABC transporter permease [Bacillaceae bacterium 44XB]